MPLFVRWAIALAFTQVVEAPLYAAAMGASRPASERWGIALAASFMTHPLVWFVVPDLVHTLSPESSTWAAIAVAEAFAVCAEALWLSLFGVRHAALLALLANCASFTLGMFAYVYLAW